MLLWIFECNDHSWAWRLSTPAFLIGLQNRKAVKLSQELALAKIGSSNSHLNWTIGYGITLFPGHSASDLRSAIESKITVSYPVKNIAFALILLAWLRGYFLRKAGWIEYNRHPEAPVRLERIPSLANSMEIE